MQVTKLALTLAFTLMTCTGEARPTPLKAAPSSPSIASKPIALQTLMYLKGVINDQAIQPLLTNMDTLVASGYGSGSDDQIDLVIDSPGGSVFSGLAFIARMRSLQSMGVTFNCYVTGMAASMAFQIFTECDERIQLQTSLLLWHPVRTGFMGVITADLALQLYRDLELTDQFIISQLVTKLTDLDTPTIMSHFKAETFWSGFSLNKVAPNFASTVFALDAGILRNLNTAVTSESVSMFDLFRGPPQQLHVWLGGTIN